MAIGDEYLFDISNHNDPVIDWARVVAPDDVPGGWLKLTQATDFVDGLADDYVAQAKGSGVLLGGYHFGDHRYDAAAQAKFFFDRAAALGLLDSGDLAPMYDVENWGTKTFQVIWPDRATIRWHVNIWLDEAVRRGCKRALVYGSLSWWLSKMLAPEDYRRDDIEVLNWIAVYNGRPGDLQGWAHPRDALHQYTSDGTFDGIDGRVDKNKTLNGRTSAGLTIGGDEDMSLLQELYDAAKFERENEGQFSPLGEALRTLITQYRMDKVVPEGADAATTTPHDEVRWQAENFRRVAALIESGLGSGMPVEGDGTISDANAQKVARFVVDELKKEGN